MPTAAIGRPTLDPWVQPSLDSFCKKHVCVLTAAIGLPKSLNIQSLQMTPSLTYSATHTCVCVLTATIGWPTINRLLLQHTCVCAHSSSWSAKVCRMFSLILHHTCVHVCAHSSNCRDPHLIYSETHTCMPTAAIGRPTLDPWVQPYLFCNTHVCVCSQQQLVCQSC